jgi:hypothetical protein
MNYSDINLKLHTGVNCFSINPECEVNVLQYLPIEDKNSLIKMAIQNAEENGILNELLLDMYFRLYTVYSYTDLEFTEDETNDPVALYDILESNGVIDAVIRAIPEYEWNYLHNMKNTMVERHLARRGSVAATIQSFIEMLPKNAESANEIIKQFNPEDFQQVLNFAKAANGGRDIN